MQNVKLREFFKNANGRAFGAFMALTAAIAPVGEALAKTHVTLDRYIQLQRSNDPGSVHRDYSPYREGQNSVDVQINSRVHGSFMLRDFNCETLVPYSPNNNVRQILATEGAIASIHAGLGYRNANDGQDIQRAMEILSRGVAILTPNDDNTLRGIEHLRDMHGIDLYRVENDGDRNHLIPQPQMQAIIGACANQLNR